MKADLSALTGPTVVSHIAAKTSTVTVTDIDVSDYLGPIMITQQVGTVAGTDPTLNGKIQDSADGTNYTDVSGATFVEVTAANKIESIILDTRSLRQYIQYVGTIAATANPSFTMGVTMLGLKKTV
jgi:hypothetical protein